MPWKQEKDPYRIWISEIILQQTRVAQGEAYYLRFIKRFPDVQSLAKAPEDEVLKLWEGLGYYSRARNLHHTAQFIMSHHQGKFPSSYEDILALKGVGEYTAAAISSFAYNLPHAVVDGNVIRVLSRVFGILEPFDTAGGKKYFRELAQVLLDKQHAGIYNQAIMDFGATICKPAAPLCNDCPFRNKCVAFRQDRVAELPLKKNKTAKQSRHLYYLVFRYKAEVYIGKRSETDIWKGLYQFPLIEGSRGQSIKQLRKTEPLKAVYAAISPACKFVDEETSQQLSHRNITARFVLIDCKSDPGPYLNEEYKAVSIQKLNTFAFPGVIRWFIARNELN